MRSLWQRRGTNQLAATIVGTLLEISLLLSACAGRCADVVIDQFKTYQTIDGWGHGGGVVGGTVGPYYMLGPAVADPVNYQYLDYLVNELGLTGSRTWEVGPRIDGTGNDHGDCDTIDWNLFQVDDQTSSNIHYLQYYRDHILARGIQPSFYSSPGYPTHASDQKPWVMNHPGERAQQIWASAFYYKNTYALNVNDAVIYNEPSFPSATILTDDIKALGPRFISHGLATKVQYAEAVAPMTDWGYITPVENDPDMWPSVGRISYHNYGTADPYRANLRDYAKARGLTTAQTEMGDPTYDDLYSDLTLGGVTYWEVAYSASSTLAPNQGLTAFTPAGRYFRLRQLIHYVRPGYVRIGTASSDASVRAIAFIKNSAVTIMIENMGASPQTVNLSGLPPGQYGVSRSAGSPYQELGIVTVSSTGSLTLASVLGGSGVTTVYPYSSPNHPPTILIWGSNPGYIVAPTTTATLSVTANDPELDPLTYAWSIASKPAGAVPILATPTSANTNVSGLTVAGTYVFNLNVSDGTNVTTRALYMVAYTSNPPPVLGQTGFRIAAPYGLVFGDPPGITHANIEQPLSTVILQAGISDLANSDFTGRGTWTLVSQPAGASAVVGSTSYIFVSIRAMVTNMNIPGDYTFQVDVTNPGHPPLTAQVVCTVHAASSAPLINPITATPPTVTLPASTTLLSATTSSPTNQLLRHWWVTKTAPAGARPLFDHQGLTSTTVSNLLIPGSYTFTLRAFDDIHETTLDKSVTVSAAPGAPVITSAAAATDIVGAPFSYTLAASNTPTSFNASGLAPGLTFGSNKITGTPTTPGLWNMLLTATNASGTGNGNLALTVNFPAPVINSPLTADGMTTVAFTYNISATNCPSSYSSTALPAGLTLNAATGIITGTPTAAGITSVTISATNISGTDNKTLTIAIYTSNPSPPAITSALTAPGTVGTPFNYTITATNKASRYLAIGLPAGLTFDESSPNITGTPLVAGTYHVTIEATNRGGTGSAGLLLNITSISSIPNSLLY